MLLGIDASNIRAGGGVTHLVHLLSTAEPKSKGIREVMVWAGQETLKRILPKPWLRKVHEPFLDRPLLYRLHWQLHKLTKLARTSCDILFSPGGNYPGEFRPCVTMSQNMLPFEKAEMSRYNLSERFLKLLLLRWSQKRSYRRADGIIFLNQYARSKIMKEVKTHAKSTVIPHGVDCQFQMSPRDQRPMEWYSALNPMRLLYVSTIDVYKHPWNVIEAIARLRGEGMWIELVLAGSFYPPALRRLEKAIKLYDGGNNFTRYLGAVSYFDLPEHYHKADAFVFASTCENMPNILLEAMASGLPIASSDRGPMPELLGSSAVYFNPEDPVSIADTLRAFVKDYRSRKELAWSAFEKAKNYSWEVCAEKTFAFLAEMGVSKGVLENSKGNVVGLRELLRLRYDKPGRDLAQYSP